MVIGTVLWWIFLRPDFMAVAKKMWASLIRSSAVDFISDALAHFLDS